MSVFSGQRPWWTLAKGSRRSCTPHKGEERRTYPVKTDVAGGLIRGLKVLKFLGQTGGLGITR